MKIAMIGQKHIPSREGGIEVVVEELGKRMVQRGHQVICYNRKINHINGKDFNGEWENDYMGIQLKPVYAIPKRGLAAVSSSIIASIQASFSSADVIHFHAEGPSFLCWFPKLFSKKVIVTVHGLDHQRAKWGKFASFYILTGEKNAVRFADEIIVLSKEVQNYFMEKYHRETVFIPNGVNKPEIKSPKEIKEKYGLDKDGYILYLGRLVPEKGIHYLIEAFKRIGTDKKLVIAGGSSDTDIYHKKLKEMSKGDSRILFTGFVQGEVLEELYSNAYIYCLPSNLEGMPLSLLEAMSYGNCCLVSDIPECTEVVEDKAEVFKRGNVEDLTRKLEKLIQDVNQVKQYKKNAESFICKKYNWDNVVSGTLEIYDD